MFGAGISIQIIKKKKIAGELSMCCWNLPIFGGISSVINMANEDPAQAKGLNFIAVAGATGDVQLPGWIWRCLGNGKQERAHQV